MRHTFLTILLTCGVVFGLACGFWGVQHRHRHHDEFERHVADVCVGAAQRVLDGPSTGAARHGNPHR